MKPATVGFDDETPLDEHVDPADTVDGHLNLTMVARSLNDQSRHGFLTGLTAGIDQPAEIL